MKLQWDGRCGVIITLVLIILCVAGFYFEFLSFEFLTTGKAITTIVEKKSVNNLFLSYEHFTTPCRRMDPREGKSVSHGSAVASNDSLPCTFVGKSDDHTFGLGNGNHLADCQIELVEHQYVYKYIRPSDTVLELGARYGSTSCAIASQLNNSGKQVSVEPDPSVWPFLEENRRSHSCNFWVYHGAVSDVPFSILEQGYGTRALPSSPSANATLSSNTASIMSLKDLQNIVGLRFNVLLIDCEGCLPHLLPGNDDDLARHLKHVRLILLEGDMATTAPDCKVDCVDYSVWSKRFEKIGFKILEETIDPVFSFIPHYVFVNSAI
jgi:FkbM family methyltransferase